jgi:osmotically-inducible protein OsmY
MCSRSRGTVSAAGRYRIVKTMGRIAVVALGALVILPGCETRADKDKVEVEMKTGEAREEAREAGREVREGAHDAGAAIKEGAHDAGDAIKEGAHDAGQAIAAGASTAMGETNELKQETDIRAALALDTTVDKNGITVKGDEATKTIRLTGTVPTADQKARAEVVARDKAEGWTIVNELTVAAATP